MRYEDLRTELEVDGSLRDIYAHNTTLIEWNRLLALFPSLGRVTYYRDGTEAPLPLTAESIFAEVQHAKLLRCDLGGPVINTHFFTPDEIELDVDPREITTQTDLDLVLEFCARVAREIRRDIRITPENAPEITYLVYAVGDEMWRRAE